MNDESTCGRPRMWARIHESLREQDEARSAQLTRWCGMDKPPAAKAEAKNRNMVNAALAREAKRRNEAALCSEPFWPSWARDLRWWQHGHCAACSNPLHNLNQTGICGLCQAKAGRLVPRMVLAMRIHFAETSANKATSQAKPATMPAE